MERELKQTKAELDAKNSEIKTMRSTMERYNQDMSKLEQQLKEQRVRIAYLFLLILVSSKFIIF
jgi:predicted  nucleic acid-binding Zn-ribbon protein